MESTFYLLPLLLLLLPLSLIFFFNKNPKNLPPGSTGWPILGENVNLALSGFPKFIKHRMKKHSPQIFHTSILGEKVAVLCGAQGNKFVFSNENKLVARWIPPSLMKLLFPAFDRDVKEPLALFKTFQYDLLKPEAIKQYIPLMDSLAREHVDPEVALKSCERTQKIPGPALHDQLWRPNSVVKVLPSSKKYTFELACRLFLNVTDTGRVERLLGPFARMVEGLVSVPVDLPATSFGRAVRGSRIVHREVERIVAERRREVAEKGGGGEDLLAKMVVLRDENGGFVSDVKIASFFVGLLLATYDATASAMAVVVNFLAELPHVYEEVLSEHMEIAKSKGPDELLTWEDIEKMKYSWNVVRESLRLAPPTTGTFSEAITEFTYAGFTIPKGWKIMWSVHTCHKNPDYFPEPEKFDPSRFEGSGPAPYTFVPFGGGPRMCPGRGYAKLAILMFIHNVVTRFRFEKAIPNEKMVFDFTPTPAHGLPLRLHPHPK